MKRFWDKVKKTESCWIWTGAKNAQGYGSAWDIKSKTSIRAHRLSWTMFHGRSIPKGKLVCHTCDTPSCVKPDHLFLGTQLENMKDMYLKKRNYHVKGSSVNTAKLTKDHVIDIRNKYNTGKYTIVSLGKAYGVAHTNISCIILRKTWKHV